MSDLISRQDIKYHTQLEAMGNGQYEEVEVAYKNDIESLPSADRPTGEWMLEEYKSRNHIENFYICSSCRNFEAWGKTELYNYCPNCGARMKGGEK